MLVRRPSRKSVLWAVLIIVSLAATWLMMRSSHTKGTNVFGPQASFVGVARCADCHESIARNYGRTGHASTFHRTADSHVAHALNGRTFHDAERGFDFKYKFDETSGLSVGVPERFGEQFELPFALGSKQHAQTFIGITPTIDGSTVVLEHRVTVYSDGDRLALTPGHTGAQALEPVELFGKIQEPSTSQRCIGCHTTQFSLEEGQLRNVLANVQCESCHGAGSLHVKAQEQGDVHAAIASLKAHTAESATAQINACGKCHRVASDFPVKDLVPENSKLARFQPVGLVLSECFKKSGGNLSCTTCHDPHLPLVDQTGKSEAACIRCHSSSSTNRPHVICPVSPKQDCVDCHMALTPVHRELTYRDHWIRIPRKDPLTD
jgi:hypothetical protein